MIHTATPETEPSSTDILIRIRLAHSPDITEFEARAICRDAMIAYAEQYGMDVGARDEAGHPTGEIDDARLIAAIERNFTDQFLAIVAQHRQQKMQHEIAARMKREMAAQKQ